MSKKPLSKSKAEAQMQALYANEKESNDEKLRTKGGAGSGNFGHAGRPGKVGGSSGDGISAPIPFKGSEQNRLTKLLVDRGDSYWGSVVNAGEREGKQSMITSRIFKRMGGWDSVPKEVKRAAKKIGYNKTSFLSEIHKTLSGKYTKDLLSKSGGAKLGSANIAKEDANIILGYLSSIAWNSGVKEKQELQEGVQVLKEKDGSYRWIAISSTTFRDEDGEIVSTKALQDDIDKSDDTGDYGTLRWWHVKGMDIGDCDFRMLAGQMLVESGKFYDNRVGEAFKAAKSPMQMSIGFFHPVTEPDESGVYSSVKIFERSVMPAGCAANRFTKLITTKGDNEMANLKEKLKTFYGILKDPELFLDVVNSIEESRKEGELSGVDFKELKELVSDEDAELSLKGDDVPEEEDSEEEDSEEEDSEEEEEMVEEEEIEDEEEDDEEMDEEEDTKENHQLSDLTFDEFSGVVADILTEYLTPINESIKAIKTEKEKELSANAKLTKKLEAQEREIAKLKNTVKELSGETPRAKKKGFVASEEDDSLASEEIKEKVKETLTEVAPLDQMVHFITGK